MAPDGQPSRRGRRRRRSRPQSTSGDFVADDRVPMRAAACRCRQRHHLRIEPRMAIPMPSHAVQSMAIPRVSRRLVRNDTRSSRAGRWPRCSGLAAIPEAPGDRAEHHRRPDRHITEGMEEVEPSVRFDVEDEMNSAATCPQQAVISRPAAWSSASTRSLVARSRYGLADRLAVAQVGGVPIGVPPTEVIASIAAAPRAAFDRRQLTSMSTGVARSPRWVMRAARSPLRPSRRWRIGPGWGRQGPARDQVEEVERAARLPAPGRRRWPTRCSSGAGGDDHRVRRRRRAGSGAQAGAPRVRLRAGPRRAGRSSTVLRREHLLRRARPPRPGRRRSRRRRPDNDGGASHRPAPSSTRSTAPADHAASTTQRRRREHQPLQVAEAADDPSFVEADAIGDRRPPRPAANRRREPYVPPIESNRRSSDSSSSAARADQALDGTDDRPLGELPRRETRSRRRVDARAPRRPSRPASPPNASATPPVFRQDDHSRNNNQLRRPVEADQWSSSWHDGDE